MDQRFAEAKHEFGTLIEAIKQDEARYDKSFRSTYRVWFLLRFGALIGSVATVVAAAATAISPAFDGKILTAVLAAISTIATTLVTGYRVGPYGSLKLEGSMEMSSLALSARTRQIEAESLDELLYAIRDVGYERDRIRNEQRISFSKLLEGTSDSREPKAGLPPQPKSVSKKP